jgi:hypothetical protein
VGVRRQECGTAGRVESGQIGVFSGIPSERMGSPDRCHLARARVPGAALLPARGLGTRCVGPRPRSRKGSASRPSRSPPSLCGSPPGYRGAEARGGAARRLFCGRRSRATLHRRRGRGRGHGSMTGESPGGEPRSRAVGPAPRSWGLAPRGPPRNLFRWGAPPPPPLAVLDLGAQGHPDAAPKQDVSRWGPLSAGPSSAPSSWPEGVGCHPGHQRRLPWAPSAGGGRLPLGSGHRHPPRPSSTAAERSPAGSGSIPRSSAASAPAPVLTTRWSGPGGAEEGSGQHPGGDHDRSGASGAGLRWGAQPGAGVAMCLVVPLALVARGLRAEPLGDHLELKEAGAGGRGCDRGSPADSTVRGSS